MKGTILRLLDVSFICWVSVDQLDSGCFWKAKDSGRKGRTQGLYWNGMEAVWCSPVDLNPRCTRITRRDFFNVPTLGYTSRDSNLFDLGWGPGTGHFPKIPLVMHGCRWDWEPLGSKVVVSDRAGLKIPYLDTYTYFLWVSPHIFKKKERKKNILSRWGAISIKLD